MQVALTGLSVGFIALLTACATSSTVSGERDIASINRRAALTCNIKTYGARGDGQVDTAAIQAAVDACKDKDGTVVIPSGDFVTGTIRLGSRMTLHLDVGARLIGVRDALAYPLLNPPTNNGQLLNCRRALLYAENASNLTIEGPGTIEGNGDFSAWQNVKEAERPMAIFVVKSHGLRISNLQVHRAAMWAVVLMESDTTTVSGLTVDSQAGETRDGLDIVDGSNIRIDHVSITSEDDSICLKSGIASGLKHVFVSDSHIKGSLVANGIKFGTASVGALEDIHFENIQIDHVAQAAMAIESVDGSQINGVTFKGINYHDTGTAVFILLGWRGDQAQSRPGSITDISFEDVDGDSSRQSWGSAISGAVIDGKTFSPEHIVFKNVAMRFKGDNHFTAGHLPAAPEEYQGQYPDPRMWSSLPSQGLYFRHVNDISLQQTRLMREPGSDARPILVPDTGKAQFNAP